GVTAINFLLPLRWHFWGGGDEHIMFTPWQETFWSSHGDAHHGRPLLLAPIGLAWLVGPGRIEPFVVIAALLCVLNGLLLAAILAHFFRDDWIVPLAGGLLLVVHPCDLSRFYVIWTSDCYWYTVALLQLGVWLYLESAARDSRLLLGGACLVLMGTGLA